MEFVWVRGHAGNQYNELCDQMARNEYRKMKRPSPNVRTEAVTKAKAKSKKKHQHTWTNELEEQYYNCITTKGRRKGVKRNKNL